MGISSEGEANEFARQFIESIFKPALNSQEMKVLRDLKNQNMSLSNWRHNQMGKVMWSGTLLGVMGGWLGWAALLPELAWCGTVAGHSCLGTGFILGRNAESDDINLILAIWANVAKATNNPTPGKLAILVNDEIIGSQDDEQAKATSAIPSLAKTAIPTGVKASTKLGTKVITKLLGKIIAKKIALKGGSKLGAKLTSIIMAAATSKLLAKLIAKSGSSLIPVISVVACVWVNRWLLKGILDSADLYYTHDYIELTEEYSDSIESLLSPDDYLGFT